MGRIDLAKLRSSPYANTVKGWWRALVDLPPIKNDQEVDDVVGLAGELLAHTDQIWFGARADGFEGSQGDDGLVVVVRGRFEPGQVQSWVRALPDLGEIQEVEARGKTLLRTREAVFVQLDATTWAVTEASWVEPMLARFDEGTGELSPTLQRVSAGIGGSEGAFTMLFEPTVEMRAELGGAASAIDDLDPATLSAVQGGGTRLSVDDGISSRSMIATDDVKAAGELEAITERYLERYGDHPFAVLLGFDLLSRSMVVETEASDMVVKAAIDHTETEKLVFHIDRLVRGAVGLIGHEGGLGSLLGLGLAAGSMGAFDEPAPPATTGPRPRPRPPTAPPQKAPPVPAPDESEPDPAESSAATEEDGPVGKLEEADDG
jgi:hypothetical protein